LAGGLKAWGVRAVTAHLFEPQTSHLRRCPRCAVPARLTHTILDSRRGNTVRLFHCGVCGDRLWDDDSAETFRSAAPLHELAAKTAREAHKQAKE